MFRVHKFTPTLPVCFLKHPCKWCSSPLVISSISLETCFVFLQFHVIISNPAIFLPIFNSMLITCHNIMVWFGIPCHNNTMLFWCAATTYVVFSLMTGLLFQKQSPGLVIQKNQKFIKKLSIFVVLGRSFLSFT